MIVEAARFPAMRTRRNLAVTGGIGLMLACALFAAAGIAQAPGPATLATPSSPLAAAGAVPGGGEPRWVVDPAVPGDDLPPLGRSLFDFLVTPRRGGVAIQEVPFPFEALVRELEAQVRVAGQAATPKAKAVLIPLGRSLQRNSAAPDFFAYPRAVVAADAQPGSSTQIHVRDRLYLGYQERADLLEVISYNEDAARFEFQIVTDYRPGGAPRVAYANRALCTACHQNGAPIFSRPVWDETNANPRVAALLAAQERGFHGIPVERGIDVPNAIDDAVLRANRFAVDQLLWNEGCGGHDEPAIRCRAGLFAALLQYRLSGQQFDRADAAYLGDAVDRLVKTARLRWPGGLALGNPGLPNRSPVPADRRWTPAMAQREWAQLADIAEAFDPLLLRPPIEIWRVGGADDVARLVHGLAEFVAEPDVLQLDSELWERAKRRGAARRTHRGACRVEPVPAAGNGQRIEFRCAPSQTSSGAGLSAEGRLIVAGGAFARGVIDRVEIAGRPPLRDIDLAAIRVDAHARRGTAVLSLSRGALHARGADGNALERFELRWGDGTGNATLVVLGDFAPARDAIAALVRDQLAGRFDGFADRAFRRARLMPALLAGVGASPGAWCCLDVSGMPPPRAARAASTPARDAAVDTPATAAEHSMFYRHCAECHLGAERTPPNFLAGDAAAVEARLQHCAPRILVRLTMWRREPGARARTPMPPEIALHRLGLGAGAWREGEALSALLQSVNARLRSEAGGTVDVDALLREGYETLRACLPEDAAALRPRAREPAPAAPARGTS